jgi:hypothetical protein
MNWINVFFWFFGVAMVVFVLMIVLVSRNAPKD